VRDYRRRSRERDPRDRRDESRDRARRRRDDSAESRRNRKRDDSRERSQKKSVVRGNLEVSPQFTILSIDLIEHIISLQLPKKPPPPLQTDDEKKAERLAKLEAWKQKQAAERDRKQRESEGSAGTRNLLDQIDKKAQGSPIQASPAPPSPTSPATPNGESSPAPYAGKFDPKAIAKKATASSTGTIKLGTDVALPEIAKASATLNSNTAGLKANKTAVVEKGFQCKFRQKIVQYHAVANP